MTITVELFGQLSPHLPRRQALQLASATTVTEVAQLLQIDVDEIGLITINSVQGALPDPVPPGSRLCLFPYLTGG